MMRGSAPQGIIRSRPVVQTHGVASLGLLEHHVRCSYAICVNYLYTAPSRGHRLPWGDLPTRI
jgi:hypothetical protein